MIVEQLEKKPFIHFGFNQQSATISLGQEIVIWQDTMYSNNEFINENLQKINDNKFIYTASEIGVFEININFDFNKKTVFSNTLKITVL